MSQVNLLYEEGCLLLEQAQMETCRPSADVVPTTACHYAKMAIVYFLKHYLAKNGREAEQYHTLEDMVTEATLINKEFAKVPFSELHCKKHNLDSYCIELDDINNCISVAKEFKIKVGD